MSDHRWQRIEDIFHRAAELAPRERSAFLDEVCAGDQPLRREVESLLVHESENGATFAGPPGDEPPRTIAHYRISGKLGQGGMGAVYRATDTKLDREVAIKVLPADFADDPARIARFTREAKVLAALNHPNIAAIYGIEDRAIVMELVEGDDLKGPLPLETALDYAGQIASALEAAHEKGITHRDLKPANIKVTGPASGRPGVVKVLDFGLAKIQDPAAASGTGISSPTLTMRATEAGVILGTAAYMAPEQARGQAADKRADIWAFGVVLWEMLTGRRMFAGETVSDILAGVLKSEPDLQAVPAQVRPLLAACLEKNPRHRLRDIGDWRRLLEPAPPRTPARRLPWVVAAGLGLAAVVSLWAPWRGATRETGRPMLRLELDLGGNFGTPAISPDGLTVAFTQKGQLAVRRLDQTKTAILPGTQGALLPFFSPNGQWIGFFSQGKLRKISVEGNGLQALCDAPSGRGGSWTGDDWIVFSPDINGSLWRVPAAGGKAETLTTLDSQPASFTSHRLPAALPAGKGVLFSAHPRAALPDAICVAPPDSKKIKTLVEAGSGPRYAGGNLLYYHQGTIFAAPFDLNRLELTGAAVPLADGVAYGVISGPAFDASRNGTVVYRRGPAGFDRRFAWLDAKGQIEVLTETAGGYIQPRFSPDRKSLAFTMEQEGERTVWVFDLARKAMRRLAPGADQDSPIWTPDGQYLVFRSGQTLAWIRSDGSGAMQLLKGDNEGFTPEDFSPDGRWLLFERTGPDGVALWRAKAEFSGGMLALTDSKPLIEHYDGSARISPDGRWLAYMLLESGRRDTYVTRFSPGGPSGPRWLLSPETTVYPVWSGQKLFVKDYGGHFLSAAWSAKGDGFTIEAPRRWTDTAIAGIGPISMYDAGPDGARLLVTMNNADSAPETHLRVLLNVNEELARRTANGNGAK